jgi:hypothetical protein
MTSLHGDFETDLPAPEALTACAEAIDGLGWRVDDVQADRIVSYADGGGGGARIEVRLSGSEGATDLRIQGSDSVAHPLEAKQIVAYLDQASAAIGAAVEGASAAANGSPLAAVPLFDERPRPVQIVTGLVVPFAFGAVAGIFLGISAGIYWVIQIVALIGGIGAGLEHRTPREGALRGVVGGTLYGAGLLIAHAVAGTDAEVKLPDPAVVLIVFTVIFGVLAGALGGWLRRRSLGR